MIPVSYEFWNNTNSDGATDFANSTRILELLSSGLVDLITLRFQSFFKTIFSLNTTDILFALIGSGKSQSVLDSLVKALLNWFVNTLPLSISVSARSFLFSALYLYKLDMGTLYFLFWFTYFQKRFGLVLAWSLIFLLFL